MTALPELHDVRLCKPKVCTGVIGVGWGVKCASFMSEWIAQDSSSYIDLAIENAACISALRDNRAHWRYQLQDSPLGDAEDLMHQLEAAFCQMHSEALSRA